MTATLPQHIAVIMDGNRRWARQRGLPKAVGHASGAKQAWHAGNPGKPISALTEEALRPHPSLPDAPEPDLLIRTGGESRISNFMLWQSAYTELYFTSALWPDFSPESLAQALAWYAQRDRRFGTASATGSISQLAAG
jgi:undecaprenyl pyrophosphate synthase